MNNKNKDAVAWRCYAKKYEKFCSIHRKIVAMNSVYSKVAGLILNIVFSTNRFYQKMNFDRQLIFTPTGIKLHKI